MHALGYQFVLTPVMVNALVIFAVAVLFNYPFVWRRYPAYLKKQRRSLRTVEAATPSIAHEDLVYALSEVDSFIDVSEQDLIAIYEIATRRSQENHLPHDDLKAGPLLQ